MRLSARSRYATRLLLELARRKGDTPVSAATLAQETGISVQFVEQILKPLKQQGVTSSVRGAAGGHRLARDASEITLAEVVKIMEGDLALAHCCADKDYDCVRKHECKTRHAWALASQMLEKTFASISLASLMKVGADTPAVPFASEAKGFSLGNLGPRAPRASLVRKIRIKKNLKK